MTTWLFPAVAACAAAAATSALAALHVKWALRSDANDDLPNAYVPWGEDGRPVFAPGRGITLLVAGALAVTAAGALVTAGVVDLGALRPIARVGTGLAALVFLGRTVGDFRYVGLFKRVRGTPFSRWDTRLYTPLTLALATLLFVAVL